MKDAQSLAAQRAREAQLASDQAAQNQRLAQTKDQAYLAAQEELRRRQTVEQQTQAESQQRLYVTQIRLAKQAWDRGDTNEVLQLLEPYHSDPARQKLCSFAWYYLWRAAHNSGSNTLRGHSDVVRQAVVTPDGSQIITFGDDGQLIVWDAAVGRKLAAVALERNVPPRSSGLIVEDQLARRASGLVISSSGAWAAAYGRNLYVGANIRQPDAVRPVTDHQSPIISLAMSPDGKRLASGDYSGEIIIRDAADGRVLRRFHNPRPQALVLSSDGGVVFAGMHDGGSLRLGREQGQPAGNAGLRRRHQLDGPQPRQFDPGPGPGRPRRRGAALGARHGPLPRRPPRASRRSLAGGLVARRQESLDRQPRSNGLPLVDHGQPVADLPRASRRRRDRGLLPRWAEGRVRRRRSIGHPLECRQWTAAVRHADRHARRRLGQRPGLHAR